MYYTRYTCLSHTCEINLWLTGRLVDSCNWSFGKLKKMLWWDTVFTLFIFAWTAHLFLVWLFSLLFVWLFAGCLLCCFVIVVCCMLLCLLGTPLKRRWYISRGLSWDNTFLTFTRSSKVKVSPSFNITCLHFVSAVIVHSHNQLYCWYKEND